MTNHLEERIGRWDFIVDRYCKESLIKSGRRGGRLVRAWVRYCVVNDLDPTSGNRQKVDDFFPWFQRYQRKQGPYTGKLYRWLRLS